MHIVHVFLHQFDVYNNMELMAVKPPLYLRPCLNLCNCATNAAMLILAQDGDQEGVTSGSLVLSWLYTRNYSTSPKVLMLLYFLQVKIYS